MFEINDKKYFIVFEQHNGKDTQRLYNQLLNHILALSEKALYPKYDFKKSHKVIIVCEEEIVKLSVIKRLNKLDGITSYISSLFFKTNTELQEDFYHNWMLLDGRKVDFLNK